MSKRRPSKAAAVPGLRPASRSQGDPAYSWLWRVFHNTYTRRGGRFTLRGWSVKIQHRGRRRTFSLAASTRRAAAAEARAIHERLSAEGWEAVSRQYDGRRARAVSRTDRRWWKERLLLRNYPAPPSGGRQREFSTHIEHAGTGCYFPLGTSDVEAAAVQSLNIYRRVIREGWGAAGQLFPREVTVAFHWAYDPLMWTYTTVHTICGDRRHRLGRNSATTGNATAVLLVETDPGICAAVAQCVNRHEVCHCVACPTVSAARRWSSDGNLALCLVNRDLAGAIGLASSDQIGALAGGLPVVSYGLHMDSEELFARTPGGASAYLLKRTAPERILEPVLEGLSRRRITAETLTQSSHSYFQRLLQGGARQEASERLAQLTQREKDVLNLMSKGYVDKEIAPALGISTWTVHEHVKRVFEKLQVHSRTEAVLAYLQK